MEQTLLPINAGDATRGFIRPDAPVRGMIIGVSRTREVFINGVELLHEESLRLSSNSPTGFSWGHEGNGATQLSLAILLRFIDAPAALSLYPAFRHEVIAQQNAQQPFCLLVKRVRGFLGSKGVKV